MRQDPPRTLPQDTIDFAYRMFDAARDGNFDLLSAAVNAGLPPNLTNAQGAPSVLPTARVSKPCRDIRPVV